MGLSARAPGRAGAPADARGAALWLLSQVLERARPLDDAWREAIGPDGIGADLSRRDRAFARHLAASTLRRLRLFDALIDDWLDRPLPSRPAAVRHSLRLAACQLLVLDTPAHAAVDQAVRQVARWPKFKGLINALCRRIAREGKAWLAQHDEVRTCCPDWLWQSWCAAHGEAASRAAIAACLAEPPLDLCVKAEPERWAARLDGEVLPTGGVRRRRAGPIEALPGFDSGGWWVQEAAAAIPARLFGPLDGRPIVDLCAAPGGKTMQLAAGGAGVTAVDISRNRLKTLRANLRRTGLAAEIVTADVRAWRPERPADAVLLDVPCSATGTIRRHPDIWHLKQPDDVARLAEVQAALLAATAEMVAGDGTLIYAACSLQPEETDRQIALFLERHPDWRRAPIEPDEIAGIAEFATADGDLRTLPGQWPAHGGIDGFYIARLRRGSGAGA